MLSTLRLSTKLSARRFAAPVAARAFHWNVSLPVLSGPGGSHTTKYHIVKPGKDGVEYDDFLIALPEREHLASFSKEVPLFIRYLKVHTDQDGRADAFKAFLERAKVVLWLRAMSSLRRRNSW